MGSTKRFILKSALLFLSVLLSVNLSSQTFKPIKEKAYQALTGNIYTLPIFVNTDKDKWDEAEINYFYEEFEYSQLWLRQQGANYNQELNFINDFFEEQKAIIDLEDLPIQQNPRITEQQVFYELSYNSFKEFLSLNKFDFRKNKLILLLFVMSDGRSHAYNWNSNNKLDMAVIYFNRNFGNLTDQYTIAHEIMHQFGAWDLYSERQTPENAQKAKEQFPHSIMISTYRDKEKLNVDPLSAWRIGWHYDYKEGYLDFKPSPWKSQ